MQKYTESGKMNAFWTNLETFVQYFDWLPQCFAGTTLPWKWSRRFPAWEYKQKSISGPVSHFECQPGVARIRQFCSTDTNTRLQVMSHQAPASLSSRNRPLELPREFWNRNKKGRTEDLGVVLKHSLINWSLLVWKTEICFFTCCPLSCWNFRPSAA